VSVLLLESAVSDQQLGLAPSTSASSEQSCFAKQSELQVEPAATEQSEEPNMTKQFELHLESAEIEQLELQIEPATTKLQLQLEPATTEQPSIQIEIQTHDIVRKEDYS